MAGGVSVREMEEIALNLGDLNGDLGNMIDITDSNDALGLGMLANPSKTSGGGGGGNGGGGFGGGFGSGMSGSGGGSGMSGSGGGMSGSGGGNGVTFSIPTESNMMGGGIEVTSLDDIPQVTVNLDRQTPMDIEFKRGEADKAVFGNMQTASGPTISLSSAPSNRLPPEEEKKEKIEYLNKLQRLEAKGFPVSRRYTMDNSLEEMKTEYTRLLDARNLEASLRFQRQGLIGIVTGLEWLNGRFDPFDLKLDGWSESVHENVEDFDDVFEELYDKYKDRGKMPPELRLLTSLAGSGFMCHVSNTFLKSRMPSADDILRQNPELARQFASAAANSAGPGFGNFMGMAMGGQQAPAPQQAQRAPQPVASVEGKQQQQTARREMKGPTGVDDILKTFEEARARELNEIPPSNGNQSAMAAVEIQSMTSADDLQSTTESTRTGGGRGRRRRAPVGNTVELSI